MEMFKSLVPIDTCEAKLNTLGYTWVDLSKLAFAIGIDELCFLNEVELKLLYINSISGRFKIVDFVSDEVLATQESCDLDEEKWYADILDAIYN